MRNREGCELRREKEIREDRVFDYFLGILFLIVLSLFPLTVYFFHKSIDHEITCVYKCVKTEGLGKGQVYFYFTDNDNRSYEVSRPIGNINEFKVGEKYKNVKRIK